MESKLAWMGTWAWPVDTPSRARIELTSSVISVVEDGPGDCMDWGAGLDAPKMPRGSWPARQDTH